ncbi:hypothetical protein ACGFN1_35295 [Streptomyces sp. NPDC048685]|uniref:hypothetical protein n=1 Tax=Streptomyces sp. NPDC048685 TaxID=3365584 RepID=UPI00371825BA
MVVGVMERRGEVGLRRALGARGGQIAVPFLIEAVTGAQVELVAACVGVVAPGAVAGLGAAGDDDGAAAAGLLQSDDALDRPGADACQGGPPDLGP